MKLDLGNKIRDEFPWVTLDLFEHGDGWYEILRGMCKDIEELYTTRGQEVDLQILQVKEKFGVLSVYYGKNEVDSAASH